MAYSNENVSEAYVGTGALTLFPITFDFVDDETVKAELWDLTDPLNPVQVLPFDSPTNWSVNGTNVETVAAPTTDQRLVLYRDSNPIHVTEYSTYTFPYPTVNVDFDRVYQMVQENKAALNRALLNPIFETEVGGNIYTIEQFATLADGLADVESDIASNLALINQNIVDIAALDVRTTQNELDITQLTGDLNDVAADQVGYQAQLDALDAQLTTNTTNISENEAAIDANAAYGEANRAMIESNELMIALNAYNIEVNRIAIANIEFDVDRIEADIAALDARVSNLEAVSLDYDLHVLDTVSEMFDASINDRLVVKADGVTINLPTAAVAKSEVVVKNRGSNTVTVNAGARTIDGAANYVLSDTEESITFLFDGTEWVII